MPPAEDRPPTPPRSDSVALEGRFPRAPGALRGRSASRRYPTSQNRARPFSGLYADL